jgi:hypothetical protein
MEIKKIRKRRKIFSRKLLRISIQEEDLLIVIIDLKKRAENYS